MIAVSRSAREELEELYDLSVPVAVIPNGVVADDPPTGSGREETRAAIGTAPTAPVLLYVGSLSAEKRLDRWLRVARSLCDEVPELVLWLVGEGPQRRQLVAQAGSLGLGDALRLLGARDDVAGFLRAADLFLLTSDSEGMPAAVLEAGMQGLPVVAFEVGGLAECVADGRTGRLVEPGDEEACAMAAVELLRSPEGRARMGREARAWCRERFSIEVVAGRYLEFYRRLVAGRSV